MRIVLVCARFDPKGGGLEQWARRPVTLRASGISDVSAVRSAGLKIHGRVHGGFWLDIGRPDGHEQACRDAERWRVW